jgi:hypothetical protein
LLGARYAEQIHGAVAIRAAEIADDARDSSMDAIAARILANAPPRFALAELRCQADDLIE